MRITEGMMASDFLFNVNNARGRINELQVQLASGKRVQKPSDDPEATDVILRLTTSLERNEQFQKNVADAQGILETTAGALDGIAGMLEELQTILTSVNNGTADGTLGVHADRIDAMLNEALALANMQFNGKYIFSGTNTTTPPFAIAANATPPPSQTVSYNGNNGAISYLTGDGITQQVNIDGQTAFSGTAIFDEMIQLRDTLRAGNRPTAADFTTVTNQLNMVLLAGSKAGSILQGLDNTALHLSTQYNQLLALRSTQQDTDVAEATLNLKQQEIMLDAALTTGAQILPKSLVDFMT